MAPCGCGLCLTKSLWRTIEIITKAKGAHLWVWGSVSKFIGLFALLLSTHLASLFSPTFVSPSVDLVLCVDALSVPVAGVGGGGGGDRRGDKGRPVSRAQVYCAIELVQ